MNVLPCIIKFTFVKNNLDQFIWLIKKRYDFNKLDMLAEEIWPIVPEHKALVFIQFTSMLDLIEASLQQVKIVYCRLYGTTPIEKRQQLINDVQQNESPVKVFLII